MRVQWATAAALAVLMAGITAQARPTAGDRVAAIASIRSASGPSFSPDGTKLAYLSNVSGSPQVWVAFKKNT